MVAQFLLLLLLCNATCKKHADPCSPALDLFPIPHAFYHPGDVIVGEIASQVLCIHDAPSLKEQPAQFYAPEPILVPKSYQHILALAFAVKEINGNPDLLPNITLGFHVLSSYYNAKLTSKASLSLLSSQQRLIPSFKCDTQSNPIGAIGGQSSKTSVHIANMVTIYKMPQLTFESFSPVQGNRLLLASMYQMVPNEGSQYLGFIRLFHYFGWTWMVLVASDDTSGDKFLQTLEPMLSESGVCVNYTVKLPQQTYMEDVIDLVVTQQKYYTDLSQSKANAWLAYGENSSMFILRMLLFISPFVSFPPLHKVWIVTCHWDFESMPLQRVWDIESFHGALSLAEE